ncbi:spondin-2a isoform X1 [Acanthochromis polyacanthus]|uniref:Spondin 2a, extracellular matrix protein n=2 Tax=Acanthochromis polyacanthus TaxID=80966 RepID=A0A3Q1FJT8_9TELE|nr:spondin-2a isoform X1 [Acanthochromis polyacanthus]
MICVCELIQTMCKPDTSLPGILAQPFFILCVFQMMSSEHLACGWLQQLLIVLVKLCLTFAGPLRPLNGTECTAKSPASYILVFTGHWSPQAFPKQYPLFRPPAQWSKLIAVSHNRHFQLWEEDAPASAGVQSFAELGVTVELMKAAKEARRKRVVGAMYRTAGIPNGIGHSSTEMLMQPRSSLLSLMVKMIPSPDWFVGVDSINLCEGNQWKQEVTIDLQPYDAGTDSGFTFSSPNFPTSPQENITKITSQMPNHPANSFYYPRLKELPPIASIKITRQSSSPERQTQMSNHILPNSISPQRFSATPLDCEVSLWSSWGLCLGPCSRGGVRHRTRYILLRPANAGTPCPELEEQAECVPHSCMKLQ